MPCALIINTLTDVLAELFFEAVCIFLYDFLVGEVRESLHSFHAARIKEE